MGFDVMLGETKGWVCLLGTVESPFIMMDLQVRCVKEKSSPETVAIPAALLWRSATTLGTMEHVA